MKEKTNTEILHEFARSTGRSIVVNEIPYPNTGIGMVQRFRRLIYIPNNSENTSFFIWFSDPYERIAVSTVFCGAFIPISSKIKSKLSIRKRNILDKLDVFSKTKSNKTGIDHFDARVVIKGDLDASGRKFFAQSRMQRYVMEILDKDDLLTISMNEFKVDFVPQLKNKSYLAIINPQTWILEKNFIETTFSQIEKIRNIIHPVNAGLNLIS